MHMVEGRNIVDELFGALLAVDRLSVNRLLTETTSHWTAAERIERLVSPALSRMGAEWEEGKVSLSQMYMSALICEAIVGTILPTQASHRRVHPPMAIVTLEDYHLLGKKIVSSMVRSAGYELIDYGQGVPVDVIFEKLKRDGVRILMISTLMLRSALKVGMLVGMIQEEGLDIKVVVGGAPFLFDDKLWEDVGADAMARTSSDVPAILDRMVRELQ